MRNRWGVLAVLFAVRLAMAFQFQSVAAIAPLLSRESSASLADIGVLIGLYFTPASHLAVTASLAVAALLAVSYRPPKDVAAVTAASATRLDVKTLFAVAIAGVMWGLLNVGFAMIFSFGPSLLTERGWSLLLLGFNRVATSRPPSV